jgi:hypothetical protein
METTTTSRLENPISREDLAHYHSDIVLAVSMQLKKSHRSGTDWW